MFSSRAEIVGWVVAVLGIAAMGLLVLHGPFHQINKFANPTAANAAPTAQVAIVTDQKTIGAYKPTTVTVKLGQTVLFKNDSSVPHTVTARNNAFDSKDIATQGSWLFRPSQAGTFKYYCIYHPLMVGKLVVRS